MKSFQQILLASAFALILHCGNLFAQPQPQQRGNWGNMDPQQMQQRIQQFMMDNLREQLAITNDAEWGVIQERLSKVAKMKMDTMLSAGMGMMGGMRRGPNGAGGAGGGFRALAGMGQADPNAESLRTSIESNASTSQLKAVLAKLRDSRKKKEAELAQAQADLRAVLTVRQEAVLVLAGMLD